jgi:DnaD/phage-associated family protein
MVQGHFRILREIFEKDLFKNVVDFRLFFLIMSQAVFKSGVEINGIILERGEWMRSFRQLQKDLEFVDKRIFRQYGIGTIKRSVDHLIAEHLVCTRNTDCGTVFKVLEYERWQGVADFEKAKAERIAEQQKPFSETKRTKELEELKDLVVVSNSQEKPSKASSRRLGFYDAYYSYYGRMLTPRQLQDISAYMDQDGLSEDLVCLAMDKASRISSHHNYLNGILNNWLTSGIRTVEQAKESDGKRERIYENKRQFTEIQTGSSQKNHKYSDLGLDW